MRSSARQKNDSPLIKEETIRKNPTTNATLRRNFKFVKI